MKKLLEEYKSVENELFDGRKAPNWSEERDSVLLETLAELYGKLDPLDRATVENWRDHRMVKREICGFYWDRSKDNEPLQLGEVIFQNPETGLVYRASSVGPIRDHFLNYFQFQSGDDLPQNYWKLSSATPAPDSKVRYATLVASSHFLNAMPEIYRNGMVRGHGAEGWEFSVGSIDEHQRRLRAWLKYLHKRCNSSYSHQRSLTKLDDLAHELRAGVPDSVESAFPGTRKELLRLRNLVNQNVGPKPVVVRTPSLPTWALAESLAAQL